MSSKLGVHRPDVRSWFGQVVSDPQPRPCEPAVAIWTFPGLTGADS
jgi:hypothetical protein